MLVEAEIWTIAKTNQGNAVLVRSLGSESVVPIFIGQLEAQSILIGMGNVPMPRPMTHDLFVSIFQTLGVLVKKIEVTALKEGTFFSRIIIEKDGSEIVVDSRPSDALGIATRAKCPIYIDESIIDEAGVLISSFTESEPPSNRDLIESELKLLEMELEKAVNLENYEEAAQLRDRIQKLNEELDK